MRSLRFSRWGCGAAGIYPENRWEETYSDRGGNLPYWLNGVIPLAFQLRPLSDSVDATGYNLTSVVISYMRRLVANQHAGGFPIHDNFNLGTWNVVRSSLLLMSAAPGERALLLPFVMGYISAAHARLKSSGFGEDLVCTECDQRHRNCSTIPGGGVCVGSRSVSQFDRECSLANRKSVTVQRFRYPDWMHILQDLLDSHSDEMTEAERSLVFEHMQLVGDWGFNYRAFYSRPCDANESDTVCFPIGSCNSAREAEHNECKPPAWHATDALDTPAVHGVHGAAMAYKEGTVRWRMTREQRDAELDELKISTLERFHGQPTGQFSADECLAGREAARGVELCTIVETMYSLGIMGQNGSVSRVDRLERIALNSLPAALTADVSAATPFLALFCLRSQPRCCRSQMWAHNYLSMINEVQAEQSPRHPWGDGENATTYGLADRFTGVTPCCTANHNQGCA